MRRPLAVTGAITVGLLLAACTGDDGSSAEPAPGGSGSPTATTAAPDNPVASRRLSDEEAQAALVTSGDLPSGWDQVGVDVTRATLTERLLSGTTEPASCQALVDAADPADTTTLGVSAFRKTVAGPWLAESVASYDESASSRVAAVQAAALKCPEFTLVASNGDRVAVKVEQGASSPVGDDSAGFRLSGKRGVIPVVADVVLVARGNTVVAVVGGGVAELEGTLVQDVAATSVGRLPAA